MKALRADSGFSLIELIVVAVIINILAGVAIVAYIGVQEKARVSRVIRTASSATSDLHSWLQSSLSDQRNLIELDTNMDGLINSGDLANEELLGKVAEIYVSTRNSKNESSPWFNRPMWNNEDPAPNGTVSLTQPQNQNNMLNIVAKEKNGQVVFERVIFAN